MFLISRTASSSKGTVLQLFFKENYSQVLSPVSFNIYVKKSETEALLQKTNFHEFLRRPLHVTKVNKDLEAGLRAVGSGLATTGVVGAGIGVGSIFGNLVAAMARNPSMTNKYFTNAIVGAAFCESLGLLAMVMAFVILQ